MADRAVYVGALHDFSPLRSLASVRHFTYVDCRPRWPYWFPGVEDGTPRPEGARQATREFCDGLFRGAEELGFTRDHTLETPDLYVFTRGEGSERVVWHYYTNTRFPEDVSLGLRDEISKASTLIMIGFYPHACVLDMMSAGPVHLVVSTTTHYEELTDPMHQDAALSRLYANPGLLAGITRIGENGNLRTFPTLDVLHKQNVRESRVDLKRKYPGRRIINGVLHGGL